jgi:1-acyl-sn-glycerol-3-phosphate acyltransferase
VDNVTKKLSELNELGARSYLTKTSINNSWRIFATGLSFSVFGLGALTLGFIFLTVNLLPWHSSSKQRWIRKSISKACSGYINSMKMLGLLTYSFTPEATITDGGKIIIANHPTLLDAVFVMSMCDNLCCITKRALWSNLSTASLIRMAGYIRNDATDFIEQATTKLKNNENLLIFPEGTRNTEDSQLEFKRGAANIAILSGCDIIPVVICCKPRTLQKHEKWYQIPATVPHFSIATLDTIRTADLIDTKLLRTRQYRALTNELKNLYKQHLSSDR